MQGPEGAGGWEHRQNPGPPVWLSDVKGLFTYGYEPPKALQKIDLHFLPWHLCKLQGITGQVFGNFIHLNMYYLEAADSEKNVASSCPVELRFWLMLWFNMYYLPFHSSGINIYTHTPLSLHVLQHAVGNTEPNWQLSDSLSTVGSALTHGKKPCSTPVSVHTF